MLVKDILEKRAALVAEARALFDLAGAEGRDATAEERQKFDVIMADADKLKDDADKEARLSTMEDDLSESRGRVSDLETREAAPERRFVELRKSINGCERKVEIPADDDKRMVDFRAYLLGELRDLTKGTDSEGGYLSPPIEFMAKLIDTLDGMVFMRQKSTVLPPLRDASTLGAPSVASGMSDADWTTELAIGTEDNTLSIGRRDLTPNPLAKWIKVSKTLLRRSTMDADVIVRDQLARIFAKAEENGFLNGSGTGEPLGVFTASANGIPVARDVSEDNTVSAFTMDGLINAQMFVQAQYRRKAEWIMHRDAVKLARKLKDLNDQYLWQPSTIVGMPDTLLGDPVNESEYAPNVFTTGKYVALYGDLEYYWIVDALTLTVEILRELYAGTNQVAYLGRLETDGAPTVSEAFSRVQLA